MKNSPYDGPIPTPPPRSFASELKPGRFASLEQFNSMRQPPAARQGDLGCSPSWWDKVSTQYRTHKSRASDINRYFDILQHLSTKCDHVTEVGTRQVVATWAMMQGRPKTFRQVDYYPWPNQKKFVNDMAKNCPDYDYHFAFGSSLAVPIEPTCMMLLDTWHSYEQVWKELWRLHHLVSDYIVLHDTTSFGTKDEKDGSCSTTYQEPGQTRCTPEYNTVESEHGIWAAIANFVAMSPEWQVAGRDVSPQLAGLTVLRRVAPTPGLQ